MAVAEIEIAPLKVRRNANLKEFDIDGAAFRPDSLTLPNGLSEMEWVNCLQKLQKANEASQFWIADALDYGVRCFGKQAAFDMAAQATGLAHESLRVYLRVAKRFPRERRKANLPFYRHRFVMNLPPKKADGLLTQVDELGLSNQQLIAAVHEELGKEPVTRFQNGQHKVEVFLRRNVRTCEAGGR